MNKTAKVLKHLEAIPLVPVFYHHKADIAKVALDSVYAAGMRVFEFTDRGDEAMEVFQSLRQHADTYPDLMLGIGSVLTAENTRNFIDAGADLIVSPVMKPAMATVCAESDIPWVPGCGTLTEVVTGMEHGATLIKIFPGSVLGPEFVTAVKPVVRDLRLMPTGGVAPTHESLKAWFDAGVFCVGMGSGLLPKHLVDAGDGAALVAILRKTIGIIEIIRQQP